MQRRDFGNKYFEGDVNQMRYEMDQIVVVEDLVPR